MDTHVTYNYFLGRSIQFIALETPILTSAVGRYQCCRIRNSGFPYSMLSFVLDARTTAFGSFECGLDQWCFMG